MSEIIEKTLLAGIGALALSQQKAEELIDDLKTRLNLGEEKNREFLLSVRETARSQQQRLEEIAQQELQRVSSRMGLVTREEFESLQKRVQLLEDRLRETAP